MSAITIWVRISIRLKQENSDKLVDGTTLDKISQELFIPNI